MTWLEIIPINILWLIILNRSMSIEMIWDHDKLQASNSHENIKLQINHVTLKWLKSWHDPKSNELTWSDLTKLCLSMPIRLISDHDIMNLMIYELKSQVLDWRSWRARMMWNPLNWYGLTQPNWINSYQFNSSLITTSWLWHSRIGTTKTWSEILTCSHVVKSIELTLNDPTNLNQSMPIQLIHWSIYLFF